jgi:hypothetical protein
MIHFLSELIQKCHSPDLLLTGINFLCMIVFGLKKEDEHDEDTDVKPRLHYSDLIVEKEATDDFFLIHRRVKQSFLLYKEDEELIESRREFMKILT